MLTLPLSIPLFLVTRSLAGVALVVAAGTGIVFLLWLGLRHALLRDGGMGLALAIGAREPRHGDLEEHQLQNVTEEMAIAAGLPAPRVLLLDAGPPNVAVTGRGAGDATIIVTRTLLDGLDRDQTQAMLGHALATVANGDPRLGIEALSVIYTFGLLMAICEAPLNRTLRRAAWQTLGAIVGARPRDAASRDNASTQLANALSPDTIDESSSFVERSSFAFDPRVLLPLPLFGLTLILKMILLLLTLFVAGPLLWTMLRRRRYLADATTVQLTRQVDPFVAALETLRRDGGIAPGTGWAEHLFVVAAITDPQRAREQVKTAADQPVIMFGVHPPLAGRIRRLRER